MRMAGLAELKPSGSVATRKFVRAIPWAVCFPCGAEGKVSRMEVFSSAPVLYFSTAARTEGALRWEAGTVW